MYKHDADTGISIHAPLAGRDFDYYWPVFANIGISIHAPLAGRDVLNRNINTHFALFQSTRPLRGATFNPEAILQDTLISIHAPLAGRDQVPQITAPAGG